MEQKDNSARLQNKNFPLMNWNPQHLRVPKTVPGRNKYQVKNQDIWPLS